MGQCGVSMTPHTIHAQYGVNMDSTETGTWNFSSTIQRAEELSEYLTGERDSVWEERDTRFMECLLYVGVFPLSPMDAGDGDLQQSSGLPLV